MYSILWIESEIWTRTCHAKQWPSLQVVSSSLVHLHALALHCHPHLHSHFPTLKTQCTYSFNCHHPSHVLFNIVHITISSPSFLAMLRSRPLAARLAVIRHLQHHDFCRCRRVHSTVFIFFTGRSLRGCVGKGHVTFIKRPCAHSPSLRSSLIFQYRRSGSFIYQWTLRSRSIFHFTYIASLLRLVPQLFSSALRYSFSFSFLCS